MMSLKPFILSTLFVLSTGQALAHNYPSEVRIALLDATNQPTEFSVKHGEKKTVAFTMNMLLPCSREEAVCPTQTQSFHYQMEMNYEDNQFKTQLTDSTGNSRFLVLPKAQLSFLSADTIQQEVVIAPEGSKDIFFNIPCEKECAMWINVKYQFNTIRTLFSSIQEVPDYIPRKFTVEILKDKQLMGQASSEEGEKQKVKLNQRLSVPCIAGKEPQMSCPQALYYINPTVQLAHHRSFINVHIESMQSVSMGEFLPGQPRVWPHPIVCSTIVVPDKRKIEYVKMSECDPTSTDIYEIRVKEVS